MPPKKSPAKKPTAKKPAKKSAPAKKPAPKKAVAKIAPKKAAPKAAAKPVVKPATLWQPSAIAVPARPQTAYTPAQGLAQPPSHVDLLKLTWGYIWRTWSLAILWGIIASVFASFVTGPGSSFNTPGWQMLGSAVDITISIGLSIYVMWWLTHTPRLMGNLSLRLLGNPSKSPFIQSFGMWFSFTWRSLLFVACGLAVGLLMSFAIGFLTGISPFAGWLFGVICICLGLFYFVVCVPFGAWSLLLKKHAFAWGKLELHRLKA